MRYATEAQIKLIRSLQVQTQKSLREVMMAANYRPAAMSIGLESLSSDRASMLIDTLLMMKEEMIGSPTSIPDFEACKATSRQIDTTMMILSQISEDDYRDIFDSAKPTQAELAEMTGTEISELIDEIREAI